MLIAALVIWITLLFLAVAFCRAAASADSNDVAAGSRYPSRSTDPSHAGARNLAGRVPSRREGGASGGSPGKRRALGI
jgi:hypothetical protein